MNLSSLPVVKLPLINLTTDPFDLLLVGLGLRMQQLSKTNAKFIELLHGRNFTLQLETKNGISRHFIIQDERSKWALVVLKSLISHYDLKTACLQSKPCLKAIQPRL